MSTSIVQVQQGLALHFSVCHSLEEMLIKTHVERRQIKAGLKKKKKKEKPIKTETIYNSPTVFNHSCIHSRIN